MLSTDQLENALFQDGGALEPRTVAVFDFDGTLASSADNFVYEMPFDRAAEEHELKDLAHSIGLHYSGVGADEASHEREARYLRHVAQQTILDIAGEEVEPGWALGIAKRIQEAEGEWYVLTSRSSPSAVRRLFHFLHQHDLKPNQVFCVGRISKHLQIEHLLDLYPDSHVYFVDDLRYELERVRNNVSEPDRVSLCQVKTQGVSTIWSSDDEILNFYDELRSKMTDSKAKVIFNEQALSHATSLYTYHAQQRLHGFRYFFTATGIAGAAFGATFHDGAFGLSIAAALFGVIMSILFLLLDNRNQQLVDCDEQPMKAQQARLADLTGDKSMKIIIASDDCENANFLSIKLTYSTILPVTFLLLGGLWVVALLFSIWSSFPSQST
ncbi:hypothetical protein [Roseibium aggregatum]|uniref:Uncharacterized protein n=1 Tax=Roseibium aggregatum TaxID=187304 RepID=A0A939J7E1_9HYPH|nr:hypothetical protein [Roseibium aggregatum]MBN9673739.1 hypothetical protein [Roseibium aggregatum]